MKVISGLFIFFFLWKLMIFFRQILFFLVRNYRNWSSLRCITLNAGVCSLTLVFTSTGNGKTLPISLTYPKDQLKTSSEEWSMSLHTISDNFVILKHKRLKGIARSLTLVIFICHMVIRNFSKAQQSSKYKNDKTIGLFCWSILLKHLVSFTSRLKVERSSDSAARKI